MTVMQCQCLLRYLGYEVVPDDIDGPQTRQAKADFEKEFGEADALVKAVAQGWKRPKEDMWQDIRYFRRDEKYIGCSCGKCGGFPVEPEKRLMKLADQVREHFSAPMTPTSTVRCPSHNAAVGGAANSRHMKGKAMDFKIQGLSAKSILAYLMCQPEVRYCYAVSSRVVHMDIA